MSAGTLLLDASVILAAIEPDERHHESAGALLGNGSAVLTTLDLARYEVAHVAVRAWSTPEAVAPLLRILDCLAADGGVVESSTQLIAHAAELAERHGISVYDAAYVAAAAENGCRLVSCNVRDLVSKGLADPPAALPA
jgi:predicted nucleic acid-binding protein